MRKVTDMMVKLRNVFLILFIILSGVSLYLSTKVNINEDIMEYLPKTSETKIGKDIMDDKFPEMDSSVLNVMFKGLNKSDKKKTLKKLENIKGVSSVKYDNTSEYNNGKYTLYILNVDDYASSKTAKNVYDYVKEELKPAGMSGSINDEYKPILQLWIVVVAITCAMIILIILSDSYVEPFLYLISIGIAVFINKGTNIIFPSVSSITNSIVAILQLALSMDYSIMLSNRYKQEKSKHKNKVDAMKEALYHSFLAISSSSVTTIVGLLALVFMSFTIGKDLGFVLAKGVLLSLVSIFSCLPALLLICDDIIAKTHKKSFSPNLEKLGKYSYVTRYIQPILIVLLFIVTYLLKGNIKVLYTGHQQDVVGRHFPATNQIAIVYDNKYENLVSKYCHELENDKKIDQVLCYSNTIGENLEYNKLNSKLKDLGQETNIDDELIKIIYYNYYTKNKNPKITLDEFVSFIKTNIYNNDRLNSRLSKDVKDNLELLTKFTKDEEINKKRSISEIANILGIKESDAEKILVLYNSKHLDIRMTLGDFVNFLLNAVANDKNYSSSLDKNTLSKLRQLKTFTDTSVINKKMKAEELANVFGIDKNLVEQLLLFYRTTTNSNTRMTLNEFANFSLELSNQDTYKSNFNDDKKRSLSLLASLSNDNLINKQLDMNTMKSTIDSLGININSDALKLLYIYYDGNNTNTKMTLNTFASVALNMASQDAYKGYFTNDSIESLKMIQNLNNYYDKELPNANLYQMFNISGDMGNKLNYVITGNPTGTYIMTPLNFVKILLNNSEIASNLDSTQSAALQKALYIMNNVSTNYSKEQLAKVLSQDSMVVNVIYGTLDYQTNNLKTISVKELINFIYNNKSNPVISNYLNNMGSMLDLAYNIINNTNTTYNYIEVSSITVTDKELVKKIFGVYDYNKYGASLTPIELVNLILNNKDNSLFKGKISSSQINTLNLVKEVMTSTINNVSYSTYSLSNLLNIDKSKLDLLFSLYDFKYNKINNNISLYNYVNFTISDVMNNREYGSNIDNSKKEKILAINSIMKNSLYKTRYSAGETFTALSTLSNNLDKELIELVYIYYGSNNLYDDSWSMTIEEFINYLNDDIIKDSRFEDFISSDKRDTIINSKKTIDKSKKLIVSDKYSRAVLNTKYSFEDKDAYNFVKEIKNKVGDRKGVYVVGNSPMAVEMSKTFNGELNRITILTMIFIFLVVAVTFKDLIIPFILVLIIQTAVYITMSFISISGGSVYFISLLIVQAILMGATIDYAIVYTSYYLESRNKLNIKDALINAYNKSIHTILSSSSILIIVTLVVANFASAIAAKICETISQGTLASTILILFVLPGVLAACDKLIVRKRA